MSDDYIDYPGRDEARARDEAAYGHKRGGPNGHGPNGHGPNGHGPNGHGANGHGANGHGANGHGDESAALEGDESAAPPSDLTEQPPPHTAETAGDRRWMARLTYTQKGDVKASVGNIAMILRHHDRWLGKLSCNVRAGEMIVAPGSPISANETSPRIYGDDDDTAIGIWLESDAELRIDISPASAKLRGAIAHVARDRQFDPVATYLEGLVWDGVARLDRTLIDYAGADDTDLNRSVGAKWMISAVARTLQPGCQADHILILEGKQGSAKSTLARTLAGMAYFGDGLPDLSNKDSADYLRGLWIVELAELERLDRSELSTLKAFATRRVDRYRPSYAAKTGNYPRRVVFIGTTNENVYLKDSTGNRRFWPVATKTIDVNALERDRDQLWAEARDRFLAGEKWHLTEQKQLEDAVDAQESRRVEHPWEAAVATYLELVKLKSEPHVTVADVLTSGIRLDVARQDRAAATTVGHILNRLGWYVAERPTMSDGSRPRIYRLGGAGT